MLGVETLTADTGVGIWATTSAQVPTTSVPLAASVETSHSAIIAPRGTWIGWLLAQPNVSCVLVGASSPAQMSRNAQLPQSTAELVAECTAATEDVKRVLFEQGNWVDQYAKESRIAGT